MEISIFDDGQLAKAIHLRNKEAMKEVLTMGEFRIGDRESKEYKYFKKVVMDAFYKSTQDVFESLEKKGVIARCGCGANIRQKFNPCVLCSGAGYCNTDRFNAWLEQVSPGTTSGIQEDEEDDLIAP
jgi:hypothetical protein